jgi:sporulation protein YlmC with PRC-barrel domain
MSQQVHLELLLGRPVLSREGRRVGRIEEVRAGEDREITEFLIGEGALLERLSAIGLFGWKKKGYRVRWDQIDWSAMERPRLTCAVRDLRRL